MTHVFALLLSLFAVACPAHADNAAQTVVHLLDYITVDYPQFVKDGKVLDDAEYKEQREFSSQVVALLGRLPEVAQRGDLLERAASVEARIAAKAPGTEVAALAADLRWKVIAAYRIAVAPKVAPDPRRGAALFATHCAACHGALGRGDGPAAQGLDPAPANFHDRERMAQRSLYGLYSTITLGVAGTSMNGYAQLSDDERWALAFHSGSMSDADAARGEALWRGGGVARDIGTLRAVATLTDDEVTRRFGADAAAAFAWLKKNPSAATAGAQAPIDYARRVLAESIAAYKAGKPGEAQRLALASYLEGFELAEAGLDAIDRNLRQEVETQMIAYRDQLRRGVAADAAERTAQRIDALLRASAEKVGSNALSPTTAAVSAFFILVREGLEALLVVAAIAAFLVKAGRREALPWIHAGWIGALLLGALTWFAAATLVEISGATRELTEGATALLAAAILLYVGFWLHDKSHARGWQRLLDRHLKEALQKGTLFALAGVSFLAVYREAFETVLFYQALWQQAGEGAHGSILVGFGAAVAVLAIVAWIILRFGLRLPLGAFFAACSFLMLVLAVIFTGHGVKALQEAGVIAASPIEAFGLPALGIYPTAQTLTAQACVLLLVCGAYLRARSSGRRAAKV